MESERESSTELPSNKRHQVLHSWVRIIGEQLPPYDDGPEVMSDINIAIQKSMLSWTRALKISYIKQYEECMKAYTAYTPLLVPPELVESAPLRPKVKPTNLSYGPTHFRNRNFRRGGRR